MKKKLLILSSLLLVLTACTSLDRNNKTSEYDFKIEDNNLFVSYNGNTYYVSENMINYNLDYSKLGFISYNEKTDLLSIVNKIEEIDDDSIILPIDGIKIDDEIKSISISENVYGLEKTEGDEAWRMSLNIKKLFKKNSSSNSLDIPIGSKLYINPENVKEFIYDDDLRFAIGTKTVLETEIKVQIGAIYYNNEQLFKLHYDSENKKVLSYNDTNIESTLDENVEHYRYGYIYSLKSGGYAVEFNDEYYILEEK